MDTVFKILFALFLILEAWFYQEENQDWDRQRQLLKDADNLATHAAAQLVYPDTLNEGQLLIDEDAAKAKFLQTLQQNLGLNEQLLPKTGSPLYSEVKLVYFQVIDERTVTFPYLYENETYHLAKYLRGPAVVAVVETEHPKWIQRLTEKEPIRVPAIQEYAKSSST